MRPAAHAAVERVLDNALTVAGESRTADMAQRATAPIIPFEEAYPGLWAKRRQAEVPLINPRPPALREGIVEHPWEYHAACALVGIYSSQTEPPNVQSAVKLACDTGEQMEAEILRRRRARRAR